MHLGRDVSHSYDKVSQICNRKEEHEHKRGKIKETGMEPSVIKPEDVGVPCANQL